ncbi:retrovirus-related pol polyprotein from transposon TNT 1-94 [Tanacetum coccineum]|uniref:Retrovirus-related pol polyprotein from transposon TNT 1-94 n=1 Tax=Tanacetum coccineum TaxID=301880 RepID=A0ABQ5GWJ8_9ASTR
MNQFFEMKGIKRDFSVARTPQQNGVAKRKNKTLIEAARTMLADSKLLTTFWAEAVNTACYVQNRVLVIKPHNKTPYKLFLGRKPALRFMRPFGCPVTILNTIDHLGSGPNWLFDIDALTKSMNYKPVGAWNQSNGNAGTKTCDDASKARVEIVPGKDYILLPLWAQDPPFFSSSKDSPNARFKPLGEEEMKDAEDPRNEDSEVSKDNVVHKNIVYGCADDPNMPKLEDIVYSNDDEDVGADAVMNNLDAFMPVSPIPTTRIHKDHPFSKEQTIKTFKIACLLAFYHKKNPRRHYDKEQSKLVPQGYTQEEGIYYDEVFAPVVRIEAIRLFLAYASFKYFMVYQMDINSAFLYGKIEEEVYVCQPLGFEDPDFPDRVYKVEKALYGLHQALRACQDKYVTEILKKFGFTDVKTASTPMETQKPLLKDEDGEEVDVHLYRSMIGSLMYLTSSRPDIMFAVYSPFDLVAYTDSDYARASLDRKSTTGGCQFLGCRLISWQCKKQTMVANSITEAEYIAASNCCGQDTVKAKTVNGEVQLQALVDKKKVIITKSTIREIFNWKMLKKQKPRKPKRKDTKIPQSSGPIEPIADEDANEENVPTHSNDPLLSGEDSLKLNNLMEIYTKLQQRVLYLENTKTAQAHEISSLKLRVKRLEKKGGSRTYKLKRLFKVGRFAQIVSSEDEGLGNQEDASKQGRKLDDIDKDAEVTLVDESQGRYGDDLVFDTSVLDGEEMFAGQDVVKKEVSTADPVTTVGEVVTTASVQVSAATTTITTAITEVDLILAQALAELRSAKPKVVVQELVQSTTTTAPSTIPKAKSITFRDSGESTTRTTLTSIPSNIKDKGKAKMIEPEKPLKMKEQIILDERRLRKLKKKNKQDEKA